MPGAESALARWGKSTEAEAKTLQPSPAILYTSAFSLALMSAQRAPQPYSARADSARTLRVCSRSSWRASRSRCNEDPHFEARVLGMIRASGVQQTTHRHAANHPITEHRRNCSEPTRNVPCSAPEALGRRDRQTGLLRRPG